MISSNPRWLSGQGFRRSLTTGLMVAIGLTAATPPAVAQNARQTDVSAGYLTPGRHGVDIVHGWYVQLSAQMTRRWSLVGELNGRTYGSGYDVVDDLAGLGGVRFGWQPTARISPFWQVLVGRLKSTWNYRSDTVTVLQPSIGVTVMVNPRFGFRGEYGVEVADQASTYSVPPLWGRVAVGGVIRLGR